MKPRHACTLAVAAILFVAAPASAGRFEEFTAKAAQGEKLKTVAATYFGGPGIEEFVAAEGLPDGGVVAFGNAWGPEFPAEPAPVGLAKAGGDLGVAALLYTYRCTIACRHCCFGCATNRPGVHMDMELVTLEAR